MPSAALPGQSSWLQYLSTLPAPEGTLAALVHGPLSHYGARAGGIWKLIDGDHLDRLAMYGHTADETSRHGRIPLRLDFPITRAARDDSFQSAEAATTARAYRAAALDEALWQAIVERLGAESIGNVPIRYDGRVIGAYGFICDRKVDWTDADETALLAIGAALGLWLTHPRRVKVTPTAVQSHETPVALTHRQELILLMVEQGLPTELIAHLLRYSASTVKTDLGQVMRMLRTDDRDVAVARARALGLLDGLPDDDAQQAAELAR